LLMNNCLIMKLLVKITLTALLLVFIYSLPAQDISRDVIVIKPYEPTISDAYKINMLPIIDDTVRFTPSFNYSILPSVIKTEFEPKAINPAKMTIPLSKLYNNYVRLGLGNYFTPYAEYSYSSLRSKEYSIGAWVKHKSSPSKLKLDNGEKVPAGYSINRINLFGKKFFNKKAILAGNLNLNRDMIHYYGFNAELPVDTFPNIDKKEIKQRYFLFSSATCLYSPNLDSSHFNYNVNLQYDFFHDKNKNNENTAILSGSLRKAAGKQLVGIDAYVTSFIRSESVDSVNHTVVEARQWVSKRTPEWKVILGFNAYVDIHNKTKTFIYPRASLQFNVVEKILVPYVGIDGHLNINSYSSITGVNPFVTPGLNVTKSKHRLVAYAGMKGQLSQKSMYRFDVTYSLIDDMHFFVNDTALVEYYNRFTVVYDDVELIKYYGEINFELVERINVLLKGNYFKYVMTDEAKAWHKPVYNLILNLSYNLRDKILFDLDLSIIGERYAKSYDPAAEYIKLETIPDLNFGIEYRYSKILSGFISLYNITSDKYYLWNQFPSQRFNFLLGFTYKL
jgi:hypothetical protein